MSVNMKHIPEAPGVQVTYIDRVRYRLARISIAGYLLVLGGVLLIGAINGLKVDETIQLLTALAGILGGIIGAVVGFYFQAEK